MAVTDRDHYLGNPNLKRANVPVKFTDFELTELTKVSKNIDYFCTQYVKITSIDEGLIPFNPYAYQYGIMDKVIKNRFTICKMPRQSGKTTCMVAIMLWFALFNPDFNIAILANKAMTSREILSRLKYAYENLPFWLQQGIVEWNKGNIELENGSKIIAASTSSTAIRGLSMNLVYLDEFAFVPLTVQAEFFQSVYPVITSGKTSRVLITSTPNGMNIFYKMWVDAEEGRSAYEPVEVAWQEVPGRDAAWKALTIMNTSEQQFAQEFECEFLGSTNTLINPAKLKLMAFHNPLQEHDNVRIFEEPIIGHTYIITVDTSRGTGNDFSAFVVLDCTDVPYKVVCTYKSNIIAPMLFPNVIHNAALSYNNAYVLVEINDIGQQVADIMWHEFEYENMLSSVWKGRSGQLVNGGFGGSQQTQLGVRTTTQVKRLGCASLKTIVESDKLLINDFDIVSELTTFVSNKKGTSYAADQGAHDDLVMCLILFSWLTNQTYFKEITDIDIRKNLLSANIEAVEDDMAPFGIIDTGDPWVDEEPDEFSKGGELVFEDIPLQQPMRWQDW